MQFITINSFKCNISGKYVSVNQALTHPIYFLMKPAAMTASFLGLVRVSTSITNNRPRHNSFPPLVTYWGQGEMAAILQIEFWNQFLNDKRHSVIEIWPMIAKASNL